MRENGAKIRELGLPKIQRGQVSYMKAIVNRLRRLENAAAPAKRERAAAEAILEKMRRLGYDEPKMFPSESYEGCRTVADFILRQYALLREYEAQLSNPGVSK